jgi:hypothetical protein
MSQLYAHYWFHGAPTIPIAEVIHLVNFTTVLRLDEWLRTVGGTT